MDEQAYRERLSRDVAAWRRAEVISEAQERAILARIGAGERKAVGALRLAWLVSAIAIIGALVLGAGIVSLFAANWDELPSWIRTGALTAGILIAYAAGWALIERYDMERIGSALLLLGAVLYEASVFLFMDIYDLPVNTPMLFVVAAAGIFPLAYLFGSRIVLLGAIADVVGFVVAQMLDWYPDSPKSESALLVVGALAVALYVVGKLHEERAALRRYADPYAFAALLVVMGLAYAFSFSEVWDMVVDSGVEPAAAPPVVYVAIGVAGALAAGALRLRRDDVVRRIETAVALVLLALVGVVATWPAWTGYAVIFNLVFFALACGFVARGYLLADERYVNFGLATLALGLLTRYVDVFWAQMQESVFFIVGGLLLFVVAFGTERLRRSLLREMREERAEPPDAGAAGAPA